MRILSRDAQSEPPDEHVAQGVGAQGTVLAVLTTNPLPLFLRRGPERSASAGGAKLDAGELNRQHVPVGQTAHSICVACCRCDLEAGGPRGAEPVPDQHPGTDRQLSVAWLDQLVHARDHPTRNTDQGLIGITQAEP